MGESDYWIHLEYRVCGELAGLGDPAMRRRWCDGLIPDRYLVDDQSLRILGHAWMGLGGSDQERWEFTLLLGSPYDSPDRIDWSALLPPSGLTRWLSVDPIRRRLVVEPSAGVPDDD